jgi:hypothetical protein
MRRQVLTLGLVPSRNPRHCSSLDVYIRPRGTQSGYARRFALKRAALKTPRIWPRTVGCTGASHSRSLSRGRLGTQREKAVLVVLTERVVRLVT